jgi:glycosyltransferase involved in cell wall biosynthesis
MIFPEMPRKAYFLGKMQPTAYSVGGFLGYSVGCKYALIFATEPPEELVFAAESRESADQLIPLFNVILLDSSAEAESRIDPEILNNAVVMSEISCEGEERLPGSLVQAVRGARIGVIVVKCHSESGATPESYLLHALESASLTPAFVGSISAKNTDERNALAIIDNPSPISNITIPIIHSAPASFDVIAMVAAFNEGDIILRSLQKLLSQGIRVYLIDNWSTDGSYEAVVEKLGSKLVGFERFPPQGPIDSFDLYSVLSRKEEIARAHNASWFIHCDVDEIRYSPWLGVSLKDAIYRVDQEGFNAIDHITVEFHPIDNGFQQDTDFEDYFQYFSFGAQGSDFVRINTWKNTGQSILLAAQAGHQVLFEGRRVYPYRFLIKHYPIRSQEQGIQKVFRERLPRFLPAAKAKGWHAQYDALQENHNFLKNKVTLTRFVTDHFYHKYLVQRLTAIGTLLEQHGGMKIGS